MTLPKPYENGLYESGEIMDFPKRKSPRILGYDYGTPNYYFITICTYDKMCIFGNPGKLNVYGRFAEENLLCIPDLNPNIQIEKYVIMPNHVHAIMVVTAEKQEKGMNDIAAVIGQYKMSVTKKIRSVEPNKKVWQRSFHDHIIRNQRSYLKIWEYIENNPLKWEEDCFHVTDSKSKDNGRVSDPPLQKRE